MVTVISKLDSAVPGAIILMVNDLDLSLAAGLLFAFESRAIKVRCCILIPKCGIRKA